MTINNKKSFLILSTACIFFLITSIYSINFAFNSKMNTAINTAFKALDSNLIYNGIFLEEVCIGGLTKKQAVERGNIEYANRRLQKKFTLTYGSYSRDVTYEELGGSYDIKSAVNEAYKLGRSGSKKSRIEYTNSIETKNEYLVPDFTVDKGKLKKTLKSVAEELQETAPDDSKMNIDLMMDNLEHAMRINSSDTIYYIPFK